MHGVKYRVNHIVSVDTHLCCHVDPPALHGPGAPSQKIKSLIKWCCRPHPKQTVTVSFIMHFIKHTSKARFGKQHAVHCLDFDMIQTPTPYPTVGFTFLATAA